MRVHTMPMDTNLLDGSFSGTPVNENPFSTGFLHCPDPPQPHRVESIPAERTAPVFPFEDEDSRPQEQISLKPQLNRSRFAFPPPDTTHNNIASKTLFHPELSLTCPKMPLRCEHDPSRAPTLQMKHTQYRLEVVHSNTMMMQ